MACQHFAKETQPSRGLRSVGILAPCHFQRKVAYANDELHPKSLYPHGILMDVTPAPGRTYTSTTWPPRGRGRGESLTSPRRIEAKNRAARALSLWQIGATWQQIADQLGFADRSGAWRAVRRLIIRQDHEQWLKEEARKHR